MDFLVNTFLFFGGIATTIIVSVAIISYVSHLLIK